MENPRLIADVSSGSLAKLNNMSDHEEPENPQGGPARRGPLAVTEELARRVIGGEWDDGAALPTEVELAEQLRVARTSVREALTRLKATRLIASRQKAGTRALPRMQWDMLDADHP